MTFVQVFQIVAGLGILNVWLLRRNRPTRFRGGDARSMQEEFRQYGLPDWATPAVGASKVTLAALLIAGIWVPELTVWGALGLLVFMVGAVLMHFKVRDQAIKFVPATVMLLLCVMILVGSEATPFALGLN